MVESVSASEVEIKDNLESNCHKLQCQQHEDKQITVMDERELERKKWKERSVEDTKMLKLEF